MAAAAAEVAGRIWLLVLVPSKSVPTEPHIFGVSTWQPCGTMGRIFLGARLRGRTATQRSKKGSEKVLGRVLGKGSGEGVLRRVLRRGPAMGSTVKKGSEKGSQKGF